MRYTLKELVAETGVPLRSIRLWIQRALLPRPRGKGPGARYTDDHANRVQLIAAYRAKGLGLDAIREKMTKLSEEELRKLLAGDPSPQPEVDREEVARTTSASHSPKREPLARPDDAQPFKGERWTIVRLLPRLALMVGEDASPLVKRIAAEIYERYREG